MKIDLINILEHPASLLASLAVVTMSVRLLFPLLRRNSSQMKVAGESVVGWNVYLICFFSGVLLTNAVPHFIHGISGEHFPAPFGYLMGNGFLEHLSNVLWGFFNITVGCYLFARGKVLEGAMIKKVIFFSGVLLMSIILTFIFSH